MDQRHQPIEHKLRVWQKGVCLKLPLVGNGVEFPSRCYSHHLIVHGIALIEKMLEDLVDDRLFLLGHLDSYPLGDDNGDAATNDVEARCLLRCLDNQRLLKEGVEVKLIVQYVSRKTNGSVNGVLEKDVFVFRCYKTLARVIFC